MTRLRFCKLGELVVDTELGKVYKGNQTLALQDLSFRVLLLLIKSSPNIVSRENIMDNVWGNQVVSDDTVKVRISLLRKELATIAGDSLIVSSVRNKGYRINSPVEFTDSLLSDKHISKPNFIKKNIYLALFITTFVIAITFFNSSNITTDVEPLKDEALSSNQAVNDLFSQAKKYQKQGDIPALKLAIQLYNRAIDIEGEHWEVLLGLAQVHIKLAWFGLDFAENTEKAKSSLVLARQLNPQEQKLIHAQISLLQLQGKLVEALLLVEQALLNTEKPYALTLAKVKVLLGQGELNKAKVIIDGLITELNATKAAETVEYRLLTYWLYAHYYSELGKYDDAFFYLEKGLYIDPLNKNAIALSIKFSYLSGDYSKAISTYNKHNMEGSNNYTAILYTALAFMKSPNNEAVRAIALLAQISSVNSGWYYAYQSQLLEIYLDKQQASFDRDKLEKIEQALIIQKTRGNEIWAVSYLQAQIYALKHEQKQTNMALEEARLKGFSNKDYIIRNPIFNLVLDDKMNKLESINK